MVARTFWFNEMWVVVFVASACLFRAIGVDCFLALFPFGQEVVHVVGRELQCAGVTEHNSGRSAFRDGMCVAVWRGAVGMVVKSMRESWTQKRTIVKKQHHTRPFASV